MTYIYPDFYPEFRCTASACRHSCCRGWEIDIDEDTLRLYESIPGELGKMLDKSISRTPSPHFVLTEDERCLFLQDDGLCRLILALGEESLCDICAEHPRFYNEYTGYTEVGLGLCCEETVRLLLEKNTPFALLAETDDDEPEFTPCFALRERIFGALSEEALPLSERMDNALRLAGAKPLECKTQELARLYLSLEQLDGEWTRLLKRLRESADRELFVQNGMAYERLAEYFVYRHFASGETPSDCAQRLRFAFLSVGLICALQAVSSLPLCELVRLYSAEIEYSDENVGKILNFLEHWQK